MADYKERQGNYSDILEDIDKNKPDNNPDPYAYEAMPEQSNDNTRDVTQQATQPKESDRILESIYQSAAPPEYNEQLQKRKEKVAKLNAAGRGINVLGDILSLSTGANVKRTQPDRTTPAMLNSYQNYIENYDDKMDNYAYRRYRDSLANKKLLYQDAVRDEGIQREDERYQDSQEWKEKQFEAQQERYDETQPWVREGFKSEQDYIDYMEGKRGLDEKYRESMINYRDGLTTDRLRQPEGGDYAHTVMLSSGTQKELTEAQFSRIRDEALRNAEILAENYPHLFEPEVVTDKNNEDVRDEKGNPVVNYKVKRNVNDEDLVRAYLEMQGGRQINSDSEIYRTGMELDEQTQQRGTQGTKEQEGSPNVPELIQEGKLEDAYDILRSQGYEDEAIRMFFDEILQQN